MRRSTFSVGMIACLLLGACGEEVEMQFGKDRSFEYGEKVKAKTLIQNTNAEHIQYPKVNTMKVGKQHLKFEADGKVFQLTITVKDTKAPEIELKQESVETMQDEELNLNDYISSVKDVVDGELVLAKEQAPHTYVIEGNVDYHTPGSYEVKVVAMDKNKNVSEKTMTVVVKEKPVAVTTPSSSNGETSKPSNSQTSKPSNGGTNTNTGSAPSQSGNQPTVNTGDARAQIYEQVNIERAKAGLPALKLNTGGLQQAANIRAQEIVSSFSHTRPDGTECFTAIDQAGVSYYSAGENIASGPTNGYDVMNLWMHSDGHRANILSEYFDTIAIGVYQNYYVQLFIGSY